MIGELIFAVLFGLIAGVVILVTSLKEIKFAESGMDFATIFFLISTSAILFAFSMMSLFLLVVGL